jgi:serine/threonine protein kinase
MAAWSSAANHSNHDIVFVEILLQATESLGITVKTRSESPWLYVIPDGAATLPNEGWKLHLSATTASAATILARVIPVVLARRICFKFASSLRNLVDINAAHLNSGSSGKFITIYPPTDQEFVRLARECDQVSAGLEGPVILSDRRVSPQSLVQYRFGTFTSRNLEYDAVGSETFPIVFPNGKKSVDRRLPIFVLPKDVHDPIREQASDNRETLRPLNSSVIVGSHELVSIIKRSNKGATYRALFNRTDQPVIAKEALKYTATDIYSRDAWYRLHNEASILRNLKSAPSIPNLREEMTISDRKYLFIDYVDGVTLREYRNRQRMELDRRSLLVSNLRLMLRLIDTVRQCHFMRISIRDLNPNNIMIDQNDDNVYVIDLELAHNVDDSNVRPIAGATKGYASRFQEMGALASLTDDVFSLGGCLYFVVTGSDPVFPPDGLGGRSRRTKVRDALTMMNCPQGLVSIITGCFAEDPDQRPALKDIEVALLDVSTAEHQVSKAVKTVGHFDQPLMDYPFEAVVLAEQSLQYLAKLKLEGEEVKSNRARLFPATSFGSTINPVCIQSGASGIGLFAEQIINILPNSVPARRLATSIANFVVERTGERGRIARSPGLYFGFAGAAWYLNAYSQRANDESARQHATEIARMLPIDISIPDVCHGLAGVGLTNLRYFLDTEDPEFGGRAESIARTLLDRAEVVDSTLFWKMPKQFGFNGAIYLGFAHGSAGIGYFLAMAGHILQVEEFLVAGTDTIAAITRRCIDNPTNTTLGLNGPDITWPYWCKGLSGTLGATIRSQILTADPQLRSHIEQLAALIAAHRSVGDLTQCHGMASIGEVLLDDCILAGRPVSEATMSIVDWILQCRIDRRERDMGIFFPDEEKGGAPDFMIGSCGVASFVLRSLQPSLSSLMLDDALSG